MGLMDVLTSKKKPKSRGICIPNHAKLPDVEDADILFNDSPCFRIDGVFSVRNVYTFTGELIQGRLKPGNRAEIAGEKIAITEINSASGNTRFLEEGERGTITMQISRVFSLKTGHVLEFG